MGDTPSSRLSSPLGVDDFCLLDPTDFPALAIRPKPGSRQKFDNTDEQSSEDEYDVVSRPASVRSFGSPSPPPPGQAIDEIASPLSINNEPEPDFSGRCCCRQRGPPFAPCIRCLGQTNTKLPAINIPNTRARLSQIPGRIESTYGDSHHDYCNQEEGYCPIPGTSLLSDYRTPSLPNASKAVDCHDHESLDWAIMTYLMSHAIEAHTDKNMTDRSAYDSRLAMNMLVRLLNLPAGHPVSRELVKLQPNLLQPLYKESTYRRAIFDKVFTDTERFTLFKVSSSHRFHFKRDCIFADIFNCRQVQDMVNRTSAEVCRHSLNLAQQAQVLSINSMTSAQVSKFVELGVQSDWRYSSLAKLKLRIEELRRGGPALRAATNVGVLHNRDATIKYDFGPGMKGSSSLETLAIIETLNVTLAMPGDLPGQQFNSRAQDLPHQDDERRYASAYDNFYTTTRFWDYTKAQGDGGVRARNDLVHDGSQSADEDTTSGSTRLQSGFCCTRYTSVPENAKVFPNLQHDDNRKKQDHSTSIIERRKMAPDWGNRFSRGSMIDHATGAEPRRPIHDFNGDMESLDLHHTVLKSLRAGDYPCYQSLATVQQEDMRQKMADQQRHDQQDYQMQLMLLEQQNKRRLKVQREAEYEKRISTQRQTSALQDYQEQLAIVEKQKRDRDAEREVNATKSREKSARLSLQQMIEHGHQEVLVKQEQEQEPKAVQIPDFQQQLRLLEAEHKRHYQLVKNKKKDDQDRRQTQENLSKAKAAGIKPYQEALVALEAQDIRRKQAAVETENKQDKQHESKSAATSSEPLNTTPIQTQQEMLRVRDEMIDWQHCEEHAARMKQFQQAQEEAKLQAMEALRRKEGYSQKVMLEQQAQLVRKARFQHQQMIMAERQARQNKRMLEEQREQREHLVREQAQNDENRVNSAPENRGKWQKTSIEDWSRDIEKDGDLERRVW